jgi:hypothetical protein
MKNTSEQIAMLKNLLDTGSITAKEYEDMLAIALETSLKEEPEAKTELDVTLISEEKREEGLSERIHVPSERKKSSNLLAIITGLMILFFIGTVLFATLFIQSNQAANQLHGEGQNEKNYLNQEITQKEQKINDLQGQLNKIAQIQPLFGSQLSFTNTDDKGTFTNNRGETCFRQNEVRYIYTTLTIDCLTAGTYTIEKRMYEPNGVLSRTDGYSTRTATTEKSIELSVGSNYVDLNGWGSDTGGSYSLGRNRVEIWCNGQLLAKGYFYVV